MIAISQSTIGGIAIQNEIQNGLKSVVSLAYATRQQPLQDTSVAAAGKVKT